MSGASMTEVTQLDEDVIIQAVQFYETYCEVVYTQAMDLNMESGEMITGRATIAYEALNIDDLGEMLETCREWVDGVYRRLRRRD